MNTLVIFYSLTGRTHYEAKQIAKELGAERYEVVERKRRTSFSASFLGRSQARKRKPSRIDPIAIRLSDFDKIIIMSPIWGGYPAPPFNSIVEELPSGKQIEIVLTSDSGRVSKRAELISYVEKKSGSIVTDLKVMKTIDLKKRDRNHMKRVMREREELERQNKE